MTDIVWDGVTRSATLRKEHAAVRHALADAARSYNWSRVCGMLSEHRELINTTRPDGTALFTPLHQAAHGGAPLEVVQHLIELGAWRTLQNARGERPIDVARRNGHTGLLEALEPVYRHWVPPGALRNIQEQFHAVIRGRVGQLVHEQALRLPDLEPMLELARPRMWFPVPGMYGGFHYRLEVCEVEPRLVSESWCRIVTGSGERHVVTARGSVLEDSGFV
jgi:hypothetical protein